MAAELALGLGFVLLFAGAEGLVRGGAALALRLGLTPLVVGLTVVAFGTSMPELVVSAEAAWERHGALAVANVVGSNIANIALILGVAALLRPALVREQLLRRDVPLVIALSVLLALLLMDGRLGRPEGALLTLGLIAYTGLSIRAARRGTPPVVSVEPVAVPRVGLPLQILMIVAGLALLVVGARLLVGGAVELAGRFGISEVVIGLTVVAVGTSLPELATSIVAAYRDHGDIAIGNVVGSCIFNLLGILGVAALVRPLDDIGMGAVELMLLVGLPILLLPLMYLGRRLSRPDGAVLLAVYGGYILYLVGGRV